MMTTLVTITHGGPDHHDVEVVTEHLVLSTLPDTDGKWVEYDHSPAIRLKNGESTSLKYVHGSLRFVVREVSKL